MKTKEYIVTRNKVFVSHPDTGEIMEVPVGARVDLTDAKAKALINKVELVVKPTIPVVDVSPQDDDSKPPPPQDDDPKPPPPQPKKGK